MTIGAVALALVLGMAACDIEKEPFLQGAESEKAILSFYVDTIEGIIRENPNTVTLNFAEGTDVTHLTPTITISTYATIEPASGVAQDFTNPVYYTVTAMDGSTAQYEVTAVVYDPVNEKRILSFEVGEWDARIDEMEKTVTLTVPEDTDVTHLVPTIVVSEGATVSPASGEAQDFTTPVTYTVTAQNGTMAVYMATVIFEGEWEPSGKTVLIKDFTGARCVNCPDAADYAHNLQHQLGEDRVIIMSVHAGSMAQPVGQFPDFITDEGNLWYNNSDSNPLFSVDYVSLNGNALFVEQIDNPVSAALAEEQTFEIQVTSRFDETSRQLDVTAEAYTLKEMDGDFYITICLVEDHIKGWQITPSGIDQEYDFRNVFRGTLNGAGGESFDLTHFEYLDMESFSYSTNLNETYNADECYLMVYVSDKRQNDKILQTAVKKIK